MNEIISPEKIIDKARSIYLRYFRIIWALLIVLILAGIIFWTFAKVEQPAFTEPEGGNTLSFTPFNDYLILMAGKHFSEEGFAEHYFISNMTVGYPEFARGWYAYQTPLKEVQNARIYYTHYGSYDAMVVGILYKLGITELTDLYKFVAVLSVIALLLWYGVATRLFGCVIALISLLTMGTSLVFLNFIDNISVYTYDILFAFGAALLFVIGERSQDISKSWKIATFAGTWVLAFLLAGNSPEFILWLGVFLIGFLFVNHGKKVLKRWKTMLLLFLAPVTAQFAHFLQVAAALGDWKNAAIDFAAALTRRTTGFEIAEEIGYRHFTLTDAIFKLEGDLWSKLRLEFIGLLILIAFTWWLTRRLSRAFPGEAGEQLWYQWKLLVVFFIAGVSIWILMIQSTVTQAGSVYRTILPFIGLTLGYCLVNLVRYIRLKGESLAIKLVILIALIMVLTPTLYDRLSGRPFHFDIHEQPLNMYYGIHPEEIKMFGALLGDTTSYGDIILTDLPVAETGHPRYPFPGYEYESERRIEVSKDVEQAIASLKELGNIRSSLPEDNPARQIEFYILVDEGNIEEDFGIFAQEVGELHDTLLANDYWIGLYKTVPTPAGSSIQFPPRTFYLFKINDVKLGQYQDVANK